MFVSVVPYRNAIEKLEKLHASWLLLKKKKGCSSESQRLREMDYAKKLDTLFDIAHADALTTIWIPEDQQFLLDQHGNRKAYMATEDKDLSEKQERLLH